MVFEETFSFFSLFCMIAIFFLVPLTFMLIAMPYIIRNLQEKGPRVLDMYKPARPLIPTNGGIVILLISIFSLSIISLFYHDFITPVNYAIIVVVILFALFGLLDDMINIGRPAKLILLYYCSYPLLPFILTTSVLVPMCGTIDLSILYPQIVITTYVPAVANLVNMHSGFNGLAPGVSLIVLMTLVLKNAWAGDIGNALFIVCLAGALFSYFLFERYPSRIFWGNIGALSVGAGIGALIVTQEFIISGFVMLIPHTVNFLLYVYWRLNAGRYPVAKFGTVGADGNLSVPNPLTLKWVLPWYFRMNERKATSAMFALTAIFCAIGFFIPG